MRGLYLSPWYGLVGAVLGAALALAPAVLPLASYGGMESLKLLLFVPVRWAVILGACGAVVGGVLGALAGRSIVEASFGLLKRIADWLS